MVKPHNAPVAIQVYLGSGEYAETLRAKLIAEAQGQDRSLSEYVVRLLLEAEPKLIKGVKSGKK